MYEDLIKVLRSIDEYDTGYAKLIYDAADAIEELQKQLREEKVDNVNLTGWLAEAHAKHLWIPVTERLPEVGELVVVYTHNDAVTNRMVWLDRMIVSNTNQTPHWYKLEGRILYWMPLPSPPAEE